MSVSISSKLFPGTTTRCLPGWGLPWDTANSWVMTLQVVNGDQPNEFFLIPEDRKPNLSLRCPQAVSLNTWTLIWLLLRAEGTTMDTGPCTYPYNGLFTLFRIFWDLICVHRNSTGLVLHAIHVPVHLTLNVTAIRNTPVQVFVEMWVLIFLAFITKSAISVLCGKNFDFLWEIAKLFLTVVTLFSIPTASAGS